MSTLSNFISTERKKYTTEDGNLFASSLGEARRYYNFLVIITDRYKKTSKKMVSNSNKSRELTPTQTSGPFIMTDEQIRLSDEWSRYNTLIHLEIESGVSDYVIRATCNPSAADEKEITARYAGGRITSWD